MNIELTGDYDKMYRELALEKNPLKTRVVTCIRLFKENPNDTRLDNHPLKKSMNGRWAFSVTDDIRIVYKWMGKTTVRFLAIGHHGQVYKKLS